MSNPAVQLADLNLGAPLTLGTETEPIVTSTTTSRADEPKRESKEAELEDELASRPSPPAPTSAPVAPTPVVAAAPAPVPVHEPAPIREHEMQHAPAQKHTDPYTGPSGLDLAARPTAPPSPAPTSASTQTQPVVPHTTTTTGTGTVDPNSSSSSNPLHEPQVEPRTKEYDTRLTPSVLSAAPTDAAEHATNQADPIVPVQREADPKVVVDKDKVGVLSAREHQGEEEKKRAEAREVGEMMGEEKGGLGEEKGTVVKGYEDEELWARLRAFDKQVTHVLSPPHNLPAGEPDLRRSPLPTVPFDSNLIRANMERLYATAGVSGIRAGREMARLMSWSPEERRRTGTFCLAYSLAWLFHLTTPLLLLFLITLIVSPRSRAILFPPIPPPPGVPPSATDPTNSKGDESTVSAAHPHKHRSKAEQVEQQSWEFMKGVEGFGLRVLVGGKHKPSGKQLDIARERHERKQRFGETSSSSSSEDEDERLNPDGVRLVVPGPPGTGGNRDKVGQGKRDEVLKQGGGAEEANEKEASEAKQKRDAMIGLYAKALQDGLGDFADLIEVFGNALTPPPYYPRNHARLQLASVLGLVCLLTAVIPSRVFAHAGSFAMGFGFFGQPLIIRGAKKFVRMVPDWRDKLDLRNSLLHHVPTQSQLTLHLLRLSESRSSSVLLPISHPLPRPPLPITSTAAQRKLADTSPLTDAHEQATASSVGEGDEAHLVGDGDLESEGKKGGVVAKLGAIGKKVAGKGATFRGKGKVEVLPEGGKGKKMKRTTKEKMGAFLLRRGELKDEGDEWSYPARLGGKAGYIVLIEGDETEGEDDEGMEVVFVPKGEEDPSREFRLRDVAELKKGGVGLPRSVLGWAAGMQLGGTSLEIRLKRATTYTHGYVNQRYPGPAIDNVYFEDDKPEGKEEGAGVEVIQFERIGRRDALFVRLVSAGGQKWETL